jgi:hypothetical protein
VSTVQKKSGNTAKVSKKKLTAMELWREANEVTYECHGCHVVLTYAEMVSDRVCPSCRELHAYEVGSRPKSSLTHPQSEPMPNQL